MKCGSFIAWRIAISGTAVPSSAPFTTILHSRSLTLAAKAVKSPTWSLKNRLPISQLYFQTRLLIYVKGLLLPPPM